MARRSKLKEASWINSTLGVFDPFGECSRGECLRENIALQAGLESIYHWPKTQCLAAVRMKSSSQPTTCYCYLIFACCLVRPSVCTPALAPIRFLFQILFSSRFFLLAALLDSLVSTVSPAPSSSVHLVPWLPPSLSSALLLVSWLGFACKDPTCGLPFAWLWLLFGSC